MQERWTRSSGGVRLQVLEDGDQGVPLLFVPGTPGPAAGFANSGHDVRRPDRGYFQDVLRHFQERL